MFRVIGCVDSVLKKYVEKESNKQFFKTHDERIAWENGKYEAWWKKGKQLPLSAVLSTPETANEFFDLTAKNGGCKRLEIQIRVKKRNKMGGVEISKTTKKPLYNWMKYDPSVAYEDLVGELGSTFDFVEVA